jgi:transposase-like protein
MTGLHTHPHRLTFQQLNLPHESLTQRADVSRELISRVTDAVVAEMEAWRQRPLDRVYAVVFVDAIVMRTGTTTCPSESSRR